MNVSSSSIRCVDRTVLDDGAGKSIFFAFEGGKSISQLTRRLAGRKNVNKPKPKDKSSFSSFSSFLSLISRSSLLTIRVIYAGFKLICFSCPVASVMSCIVYIRTLLGQLIRTLLVRGGVEMNPGPGPTSDGDRSFGFQMISQNCRGLTDRKKLVNILRGLYPFSKRMENKVKIACLQETHQIDKFTANLWFRGVTLVDNGERNQRGVAILIPDGFVLTKSRVSGVGRWAVAVVRSKEVGVTRSLIVVNIYAPNCHRESIVFFQDLFRIIDDVVEELVVEGVDYDIAMAGDFNVVLDHASGASNRATNRAERELASLICEELITRDLMESKDLCQRNCHTWRRGTCLSKLDYIFLSRSILSNVTAADIQWHGLGSKLDHAMVRVRVEGAQQTRRGRGFTKLYKSDISKDEDRQWLLQQLQQCESQIPTYWDPHVRLEFIKTMLRSKTLELRQMNKYIDNADAVRNEIQVTMLKLPLSVEDANKLEALKIRLSEIEDKEAESLRIRAGVRWREDGEKSTSYFLARFKARTEGATMHSIRLINRIVKGTKEIGEVVLHFYKRLYEEHLLEKLDDSVFCDSFFANCPTLTREHKALLAKPIDLPELKEALKSCPDSAPGLDGIPYSFYSSFQDFLLKYVIDSWNYAKTGNSLAASHRRSCISLLPKQGKDLMQIGNWRPISLSACDLKIITKAYANRLKGVLPDILSETQAAYVPGRDISFNNRLIQCARRYSVRNNLDFCLISLDAQKAFDSVSHKYLIKVMETYEFPQEFIDVFKTLYTGLTSVVQVNGTLTSEFELRRGVKQGDALSCGLFVLAIDPLLRNLSENPHIEGLLIPTSVGELVDIKVLSYADDVAIVCKNNSLQPVFSEYEKFSYLSGLILNADKTEVFNFCQSQHIADRIRYLENSFDVGRVAKIRICGIWLAEDPQTEYKYNVLDKITAMESTVLGWGKRHLSFNGRMIVAKTFLLSLIVFPAQVITINRPEIKKIEKLIYSYVNGAKNLYGPERISRRVLKAAKDQGGIGGVDVESFVKSLAVKQFEKAARTNRTLGQLQSTIDSVPDEISMVARAVLRSNCRSFAALYAMPDLRQIELISGIPMVSLLTPSTNASSVAAIEQIDSLGSLQEAFNDRRRSRTRISTILRAVPKSMADLIRAGTLIQSPVNFLWLSQSHIAIAKSTPTKVIRISILTSRLPDLGVKLEKIYKRADWPPPGATYDGTFKNVWNIKNPTLRASRLKVIYKDVFSNERRFRFGITNSPACEMCGQIETVEHQLYSCNNAARIWNLYQRITGVGMDSLFEVICCGENLEQELIKSVLIKALIQINRSCNRSDKEIITECLYYLGIELAVNRRESANIQICIRTLRGFR